MYKHFIWDFDGTLFDSYPAMVKAYEQALSEQGIHLPQATLMAHMKISLRHLMAYTQANYKIDDTFIPRFSELRPKYEQALLEPYKEAVQALQLIRHRMGHNYVYTHRGASTYAYLEKYDLLNYFDELVTADNHFALKPDPEGVTYLINKYRMDPDQVLMIGDRELDILSGQNAGVDGCFYSEHPDDTCPVADHVVKGHLEVVRLKPTLRRKKETE